MAFTLEVQRKEPQRTLKTGGLAPARPLNTYCPPFATNSEATPPSNAVLAVAFTQTNVSATIDPTADNAVTVTNGTAREFLCIGGHAIVTATYFRASARRKPGSTGAIVANTVEFVIDSASVGKFDVLAAAAGVDPICGSVEMVYPGGDIRFDITAEIISVTLAFVDADLEVFFEIIGQSS